MPQISDNYFHGNMSYCIGINNHGSDNNTASNVIIDNNYYSPSVAKRSVTVDTSLYYNTPSYFISMSIPIRLNIAYYAVTNNKAYFIREYFLNIVASNDTLHNFTIGNNVVRFYNRIHRVNVSSKMVH